MNSIELGKKTESFFDKYVDLFGYVPCPSNYICNNREFLDALIKAVEQEVEITKFLKIRELKPGQPTNI